jgi:hypothetical protein
MFLKKTRGPHSVISGNIDLCNESTLIHSTKVWRDIFKMMIKWGLSLPPKTIPKVIGKKSKKLHKTFFRSKKWNKTPNQSS